MLPIGGMHFLYCVDAQMVVCYPERPVSSELEYGIQHMSQTETSEQQLLLKHRREIIYKLI